ncbi:ABC transporter permease [Coprobacter sp.]
MNKINLIIQQEYLNRIRKRSFIIMTLLMPFLFVTIMFVPNWLSSIDSTGTQDITVLDYTGLYEDLFTDTPQYRFNYQTTGKPVNHTEKPYAYITISDNLIQNSKAIAIYSEKQISQNLKEYVTLQTEHYLENEKLASYQIPNIRKIIADSQVKLNIPEIRLSENESKNHSSAETSIIIGITGTFIIYMFLLLYGVQVMQSVTQEKSSRIVEVMISSVKPFELMMGKIVAIGLAGLTQFTIWLILSGIILSLATPQLLSDMSLNSNDLSIEAINLQNYPFVELLIYFILFFIGGYMLYASLFAAIGAAVDNESDTQQFMVPVTIIILFALYTGIYSAQFPEGPLAFWCSMIPFTSPIVMMVRLPFGIPFWETALSLLILSISTLYCIWISGRIYRVGILMYGKKTSYREIIKWIRYKG